MHLCGQNRLQMNLHVLNKIPDFEFSKCVQKMTKKQALPPALTSLQKTVGLPEEILMLSAHKFQ